MFIRSLFLLLKQVLMRRLQMFFSVFVPINYALLGSSLQLCPSAGSTGLIPSLLASDSFSGWNTSCKVEGGLI